MVAVNRSFLTKKATAAVRDDIKKRLGTTYWRPLSPRTQIISPQLCVDAGRQFLSRLPEPQTCDLVDVRPGIGLWSEELNLLLKPRRHILVEPDTKTFSQFYEPLAKKQGWNYQTTSTLLDALDPEKKFLSEENLHKWTSHGVKSEDNASLVLNVNLAGPSVKGDGGVISNLAREFAQDLWISLFGYGSQLYRYGTIKILAWLKDADRHIFVPRSVEVRTKLAVQLELAADIREICSTAPTDTGSGAGRRWHYLDAENQEKILQRKFESRARVIHGRTQPRVKRPALSLPPIPRNFDRLLEDPHTTKEVRDLINLDRELATKDPEWHKLRYEKHSKRLVKNETPEQHLWRILASGSATKFKLYRQATAIINEYRDIHRQWIEDVATAASKEQSRSVKKLKARAAKAKMDLDTIRKDENIYGKKAIDDYRAYDLPEQVMHWNRREMEPLACFKDEFLLEDPMTLLEITIRPETIRQLESLDSQIYFRYVLSFLWQRPAQDMQSILSELLHGKVDEFVTMVPRLRDPSRGGWFDLSDLRPRTLPADLVLEIALAYEKWPYRLSVTTIWNLFGPIADRFSKKTMR